MNYISINLYKKMVYQALKEGVDQSVLNDLPVSIEAMKELQAVPADSFFRLHELLNEALGPGFSIRVGQEMKMDDYGVLGMSWKTCSKAGEIFERCERYFKLLSDTYVFKVSKEGHISRVYLYRDAYRHGIALSNQATFSATVVVLQAMTEHPIYPVEVAFKHTAPTDLSGYQEAFQCPVLFNQADNYMAYRTEDLERRTAKADRSINAFLLERVEEETKGIEVGQHKITTDVEQLIQEALPSGIPGIGEIGKHMGMSGRTLTRRLSEQGFTFRTLVRQTQERIARELLLDPARSIGEIAYQTGFSEQSAFNRAFKRWTGDSPTAFRRK